MKYLNDVLVPIYPNMFAVIRSLTDEIICATINFSDDNHGQNRILLYHSYIVLTFDYNKSGYTTSIPSYKIRYTNKPINEFLKKYQNNTIKSIFNYNV